MIRCKTFSKCCMNDSPLLDSEINAWFEKERPKAITYVTTTTVGEGYGMFHRVTIFYEVNPAVEYTKCIF